MTLLHSSRRRPPSLQPQDYDHRIDLVDSERDDEVSPARTASTTPATVPDASDRAVSPEFLSTSTSRQDSITPLRKNTSLRKSIAQGKYSKQQDDRNRLDEGRENNGFQLLGEEEAPAIDPGVSGGEERGRPRSNSKKNGKDDTCGASVIEILYENQRGGILCGCLPLFSAKALGNLDPSPWTNVEHHSSPTNIYNAQVPDPTWRWQWKEWVVNHEDGVDEGGWEYSFMFSKKYSWHGPAWWNSFVRRRVWTRKRVQTIIREGRSEEHALNADYFTISNHRSKSRASGNDSVRKRYSGGTFSKIGGNDGFYNPLEGDICDILHLMRALKACRIDREKMEAIENFIQNGEEELYYIHDRMAEIMHAFIFQASRRMLLSHLSKIIDKEADEAKKDVESEKDPDPSKQRRIDNLEAALKAADKEVQRLEFWSDVKVMAESGETKGAVGGSGWKEGWAGADNSGPKDVISNRKLPGKGDCEEEECTGEVAAPAFSEKGKEKATE